MATITGKVFHDVNHDGQYTADEPGIPHIPIMLYTPNSCTSFLTDASGNYNFTITAPGTYIVYETATNFITACPPITMAQPKGFTLSNSPRKQTMTVTKEQIDVNAIIQVPYFSHDTLQKPPEHIINKMLFFSPLLQWYTVDHLSATMTLHHTVALPDHIGAVVYHPQDQFFYGYDQKTNKLVRINESGAIVTLFPHPEGLPDAKFSIGAIEGNGLYYLIETNSSRFYTIDLGATSPTFMKLVNPSDHTEQTESFGTAMASIHLQALVSSPMDQHLYGVDLDTLVKINPSDGKVQKLVITGEYPVGISALSIDKNGTLYGISNSEEKEFYQFTLEKNTVFGQRFFPKSSSSHLSKKPIVLFADAMLQPATFGPQSDIDLRIFKTAAPNPVSVGATLQYTIIITNRGPEDAVNIQLTDTVPFSLSNVEFSTNGFTWEVWKNPYSIDTVAAGSAKIIYLRGTVNSAATAHVLNTATVTSDPSDPNHDSFTSSVSTAVTASANLSVQKTAAPAIVNPNETLTYTMIIRNTGPSVAQNVRLTDSLPSVLKNPEFSTDNGANWFSWTGVYETGFIPADSIQQILLRATVDDEATGTITNTVSVTSDTPDPDLDNNSATEITAIGLAADLSLSQTVSPSPATAGQSITYTISVTNKGPNLAQNVLLTDIPPSSLTNIEFSADNGTTWTEWASPYNIDTVAAGQTATILLRGTLNDNATGTITNTPSVISDTPDPNPNNNTVTTVTAIGTEAKLSITKTTAPSTFVAGKPVEFTITVQNAGPDEAKNVTILDQLSQLITSREFSTDNGNTWTPWTGSYVYGNLANDASISIKIRGILSSQATGILSNTASVTSITPDTNSSDNTVIVNTPITAQADLTVTKTADKAEAIAGDLLQYTVTISNQGPSDAFHVTVIDSIDAGLTQTEYSLDGGNNWRPWTGSDLESSLPNGGKKTLLIRGRVDSNATGQINNTAIVTSDTPDPDLTNNTANILVPIASFADLSISKTADSTSVAPGQQITYTLTAKNLGPNTADNVIIKDILSTNLTNAQYAEDNDTTWKPWTGSLNIGAMPNSTEKTVRIRADLVSSATDAILNTASIDSTTKDPNPNNNIATITTPLKEYADLSIIKTANPTVVSTGDQLTYTITVQNLGISKAQHVSISDTPPYVESPEFSIDYGKTWNTWESPYELGDIENGLSKTILIRGIVSAGTDDVINTAVVRSDTPDPDPNNNTSTVTVQRTQIIFTDLSIQKTAQTTPLIPDNDTIYEITIKNNSNTSASNVIVYDNFESNFTNTELSTDNGQTWQPWTNPFSIGTMPQNSTKTLLLKGILNPTACDTVINTATVTSTTPDPNPSNNTVSLQTPVQETANLSVTKQPDHSPVHTGDILIYTITVSNAGPAEARNVVLTDPLDKGQWSIDNGKTWQNWNGSYCLGTLANGESNQILIRTYICKNEGDDIGNTATVTSTTFDPDLSNNTATVTVPFEATADLCICQKLNQASIMPCQRISYQVTVENRGPDAAENVVITEEIPTELCHVQFSVDGGRTWANWTGSFRVGTMPPGAWLTILFCGNVKRLASGRIDLTTTVHSPVTLDPQPKNNSASGSIRIIRCCMPQKN